MIKVSRTLKETATKAYMTREALEKSTEGSLRWRRSPQRSEPPGGYYPGYGVIGGGGITLQDDIPGDGNAIFLMDKLVEKQNPHEDLLNHMVLNELIGGLTEEERTLIRMRYFEDKTQVQVAQVMGMSQVQVSRFEKNIKQIAGKIF